MLKSLFGTIEVLDNKEVKDYYKYEGNSYVIRLLPNQATTLRDRVVWGSKKETLLKTFNNLLTTSIMGEVSKIENYFFRPLVTINSKKLREHIDREKEIGIKHTPLMLEAIEELKNNVRHAMKKKRLDKDFKINMEIVPDGIDLYDLDFKSVMHILFKSNGGFIDMYKNNKEGEFVGDIFYGEYEDLQLHKEELKKAKRVIKISTELGYNLEDSKEDEIKLRMPINKDTKPYIMFEERHTLVTMKCMARKYGGRELLNMLLTEFQTTIMDKGEVTHYSKRGSEITLNFLCKNEELDYILDTFMKLYNAKEGSFHVYEIMVDILIEKNIGQNSYEESWFYLINGVELDKVRQDFTLNRGTKTLGLNEYN
ncbi:hypothetical protein P9X10_02650 [Bacillus cereus]|nr:hypothetical protein [Bacillus cereus]